MGRRIGRVQQTSIYVGKCWRLFVNEKQWKNCISTAIIMFLISLVTSEKTFRDYIQTRNSCFAIICACIWIGLFNSIQSICRERGIIKREHRTGLSISAYICAHVIFEAIVCTCEGLIVLTAVLIGNSSHLPESGVIFPMGLDLFLTLFLAIFASDMMAILVSSIVKDSNSAMTVMPFVLIIQLIMAGVVFDLSGITDRISNITVSKWGLNGLMSIALTSFEVSSSFYLYPTLKDNPWQKAKDTNLALIWLILLLIAMACVILSVFALNFVDRDKR